jgi:hypothetical protein
LQVWNHPICFYSSTTTVDLPVGWLYEPEQAARWLLDGDNDCACQ